MADVCLCFHRTHSYCKTEQTFRVSAWIGNGLVIGIQDSIERPPKKRAAPKYYNPENNEMAFPSGHSTLLPVVLRNAEAMSVAYEYRYSKRKSPYRVAYFDL